jgi:hypothetical protein
VKRAILCLVFILIFSLLATTDAFAQYVSPSYKAEETFFGSGGELDASSTGYKAQSSSGALGVDQVSGPINFIQGNQNFDVGPTTTVTAAFSSNVTTGDLLVVAVGGSNNATFSITDTQGNTYIKAKDVYNPSIGFTGYTSAIYYTVAKSSSADTVQAYNAASSGFMRLLIHEYSGANALDATSSNTGNSSTVDSGSAATNFAHELVFGWLASDNGVTSAGSGFTLRETAGSESTMDKEVTSKGSYSVTAPTSSSNWIGAMATFFESNGGAYSGFLTPNEPFLEMTVNTSSVNLGVLDSTAAKTGTATFNVRAYTSSGYTVASVSAPPKTSTGITLTPMSSQGASTVGTEQFGINLRANTSPTTFGADPTQQPDSTFAGGYAATGYDTANQYKYNQGDVIAQTVTGGWGLTTYTISYIGNISSITRAGSYSMTHDLVVVATY